MRLSLVQRKHEKSSKIAAGQRNAKTKSEATKTTVPTGVPLFLQAKLKVNAPGDVYEQEADHVADQIMRMPQPNLQRSCSCGGECPKCQNKQLDGRQDRLAISRVADNTTAQIAAPPAVDEVLSSSGQPLDPSTRALMEQRFNHDFGRVRVHTGEKAEQSAREVSALAYTVGHDVVFGSGQYVPGTRAGQRLLAHELVHTIQQTGSLSTARDVSTTPSSGALRLQRQPTLSLNKNNLYEDGELAGQIFFNVKVPEGLNPKDFAIVQWMKGCVIGPDGEYTYNRHFGKKVDYNFPEPVVDSIDTDPMYKNGKENRWDYIETNAGFSSSDQPTHTAFTAVEFTTQLHNLADVKADAGDKPALPTPIDEKKWNYSWCETSDYNLHPKIEGFCDLGKHCPKPKPKPPKENQ